MEKKTHFSITLILIWVVFANHSFAEEKKAIQADEIGISAEITGTLGVPLWEVIEIEAQLLLKKARHAKEGDRHIAEVYSINGKNLEHPVEIIVWEYRDEPTEKKLKIKAMEVGRLVYYTPPSLSSKDKIEDYSSQRIFTGLKIIEIKP